MNLNNKLRTDFVDAVLAGIPVVNYYNRENAKQEIRKEIEKQMPADIQAFAKKYPDLIERNKNIRLDLLAYEDARGGRHFPYIRTVDHSSAELIPLDKWVALKTASDKEQAERERETLHDRLTQIASACTTLAKLKEAMPELISYMPEEVEKRNLPITTGGLVTELLAAGLSIPKEGTK